MHYAKVLVPVFVDQAFTYAFEDPLPVGCVVKVPFRSTTCYGCVWSESDQAVPSFKTKKVLEVTPFVLPETTIAFVKWVARYTLSPEAMVLKMVLSIKKFEPLSFDHEAFEKQPFTLSPEQKKAADTIKKLGSQKPILLDGITGSGKTEVYLDDVAPQTLIMVPEIALTNQVINRIARRFKHPPCVWHSKITAKQKQITWQKAISGEPIIVLGARSALFLPFKNLGLIVVDEEHETSYKQDSSVLYHARDMAILRASLEKCKIVLSSATPSLETFHNVQQGLYERVELSHRFGKSQYPTIEAVDISKVSGLISQTLKSAIEEKLLAKQQIMLFLNRRGYAPALLCPRCGFRLSCKHCSASLVFHKRYFALRCHYCMHDEPYTRRDCPKCDDSKLIPWGPGIEKVQEELKNYFPKARVLVMTSDTMTTVKKLNEALSKIHKKEVDIILGTQILAKGHHFPNLTLVGIIDADMGLNGIDFRGAEHTYQLLHQVAGRCGREEAKGHVILQTLSDERTAIKALLNWDRQGFMEQEIKEREKFHLPPFSWFAAVILSSPSEEKLNEMGQDLARKAPRVEGISVLGPIPAPLYQLQGLYRSRFLVKSLKKGFYLQDYLKKWLDGVKDTKIDINPFNFY